MVTNKQTDTGKAPRFTYMSIDVLLANYKSDLEIFADTVGIYFDLLFDSGTGFYYLDAGDNTELLPSPCRHRIACGTPKQIIEFITNNEGYIKSTFKK